MRINSKEIVYIRAPLGIPLPELSIEQVEQLNEEHMTLEYCYDLLVMAYQKSRELNDELTAIKKDLRRDNDRLINICNKNGLSAEELAFP
jgi:hypothetical protein